MSTQQPCALGVDVSHYQPEIDWKAVKEAGISFAFAKATEGSGYRDPSFDRNWRGMKEAGILRGAYHFFRPTIDPEKQAELYVQTVKPGTGDLPPALDVEAIDSASRDCLIVGVTTWLQAVEQMTGCRPMIYTAAWFWDPNMCDSLGHYPAWIKDYPLWVAHYAAVEQPKYPAGWNAWTFWQYSSTGRVAGVGMGSQVDMDLDRFNGSIEDLCHWVEGCTPVPVLLNMQEVAMRA